VETEAHPPGEQAVSARTEGIEEIVEEPVEEVHSERGKGQIDTREQTLHRCQRGDAVGAAGLEHVEVEDGEPGDERGRFTSQKQKAKLKESQEDTNVRLGRLREAVEEGDVQPQQAQEAENQQHIGRLASCDRNKQTGENRERKNEQKESKSAEKENSQRERKEKLTNASSVEFIKVQAALSA
jgi:hypothetical protein